VHHRRGPGAVRGGLRQQAGRLQDRRDHPRQEDLRPGPGPGVQQAVHQGRRQGGRGRDDQRR
jgi:hypothetical protein